MGKSAGRARAGSVPGAEAGRVAADELPLHPSLARVPLDQDGGDVITLSKRLGHSSPQVTMTTYADAIEEANDHSIRKARVDALFADTQMARSLAAPPLRSVSQ